MTQKYEVPDGVPDDEYLLAEAIAAQQAVGYGFTCGTDFSDSTCCVQGALILANIENPYKYAWHGNDQPAAPAAGLTAAIEEDSFMLGYGFRCFNLGDEA